MHKLDYIDLGLIGGGEGRGDCQWGWYDYVKTTFAGQTLLDVGTGISKIKERFTEATVTTHEESVELTADIHGSLDNVESKSFDNVTCFDVIEHVKDYGRLAYNMARISRRCVFLTTPGVDVTHQASLYHFHEFEPWEILQLMESTGMKFKNVWSYFWDGPINFETTLNPVALTQIVLLTREQLLTEKFLHPTALLMTH